MSDVKDSIDSLVPDDTVQTAAVTSVRERLTRVRRRFSEAAAKPGEAEPIHRLRVATRRATAAIELYIEFLPPRRVKRVARLLKRVRRKAGKIRDRDILLARLMSEAADERAPCFVKSLERSRARAAASLSAVYRKKVRSGRFKRKVRRLLRGCLHGGDRCARASSQRFGDWAPRHLQGFVNEFFEASCPELNDFAQLHAFRIKGKALRYAMELVAAAFPKEFRRDLIPTVERLQELLGTINDDSNFLKTVASRLSETAHASDIAGLTHLMAQGQRALADSERTFATLWTAERRDDLKRRLDRLLAGSPPVANGQLDGSS